MPPVDDHSRLSGNQGECPVCKSNEFIISEIDKGVRIRQRCGRCNFIWDSWGTTEQLERRDQALEATFSSD